MYSSVQPFCIGTTIFLNRAPIINKQKQTQAYRLSFLPEDGVELSEAEAIARVLEEVHPDDIVGNRAGLVRVSAETAATLFVPLPWRKKIVPEVAIRDAGDEILFKAVKNLRDQNSPFCACLSTREDVARIPAPPPFAKVDIGDAASFAGAFGSSMDEVLLIADRVATTDLFEQAKGRGFDLCEGDFYIQPSTTGKKLSASQSLLLDLSRATVRNDDIEDVEAIFRKDPDLTYGLLNLAHSAYFRVPETVTSIRQAVALLGYDQLNKWVALMLFNIDNTDSASNPLFERAIIRARIMELTCWRIRRGELADPAFVTGLFSLVHVLLGISLDQVLGETDLSPEIKEALLQRTGPLGTLLSATEKLEEGALDRDAPVIPELPFTGRDVLAARSEAIMAHQAALAPTSLIEVAVKARTGPERGSLSVPTRTPEPPPSSLLSRMIGWLRRLLR